MTSIFNLGLTMRRCRHSPAGDQGEKIYGLLRGFIEDILAP